MRKNPTRDIEQYRRREGLMGSSERDGPNGAFIIPYRGVLLKVIASNGEDWEECGLKGQPWEHVSVSTPTRCPTWEEMDYIKQVFWRDDELVLQFHVPRDQHINNHPFVLHLWKPTRSQIPLPPSETVGEKT